MATQQQPPNRVPLTATLDQRAESSSVDSRLINAYVEKMEDGTIWAVKRPGFAVFKSPGVGGLGVGCFYWAGKIYSVSNGHLWEDTTDLGTVDMTGGFYYFNQKQGATQQIFLHNATHAYYYDAGGGLVEATAAELLLAGVYNFFAGSAFLDGTTYLPAISNSIFGSGINDYTTWNALNLISAQMLPDGIQYLFRQLNYVVALKQSSFEAFIDAGNATGSPLQSAPGTFLQYGCRAPNSVAFVEGAAIWAAATLTGGTFVMMMENMKPKVVSTPAVERLLQQADFTSTAVFGMAFRISGHRFYLLTLVNSNISLAFDMDKGIWYRWTDKDGNCLPYGACTTTQDNQAVFQNYLTGVIYKLEATNYVDGTADMIPVDVYTPNWDGGTRMKKYNHRVDIITDQQATGILKLRHSDDDYKTYSNFRTVDLLKNRPALFHNGTFRKRSWHARYEASTPFRMRELELDVQMGSS